MTEPTFAERFAYARWIRHLETGEAPGNAEIGRAVERTGQAVSSWTSADDPPKDFRVHGPLAGFLAVNERWLIRGEGDPPRPELWNQWLAARRVPATGPAALAHAVRQTVDSAELERKDIPAKRPKRKGA